MNELNTHIILQDILLKEQKDYYLSTKDYEKTRKDKLSKLLAIQTKLNEKALISINEFDELRLYAISPGGFLNNELRKTIYAKIFAIDNISDQYDLILIDETKKPDYKIDNYELDAFTISHDPFDINRSQNIKIIEADVKRSKLGLALFEHKNRIPSYEAIVEFMKEKLQKFITEMTSINNSLYNYYQGYHDVGLYFLFLYYDNFRFAVEIFQRFSEFFLKEHLLDQNAGYNFTNSLTILKEIITIIDKSTWDDIEQRYNGNIAFAISWILTCFSHNITNNALVYRLLDYFIVSHPISIYHLSAWIIIEESKKVKKTMFNEMSLYVYFQQLNMDEIDFDYYIMKSNESLNKYPIHTVQALMKKINLKHCYPLINDESYTKKWIMYQNANKEGFYWYLKGKFKAMWNVFAK